MKKLLFLLMTSFLVLAACGNEESKSEDKKETKASDKESEKKDKKKDENKKSNDDIKEKSDKENTDKKEISNADNNQQEDAQQANTEQQTQTVEQSQSAQAVEQPQATQEPVQSQEQTQPVQDQNTQQDVNAKETVKTNNEPFKPEEHGGGHPQLYTNEDLPDDIGEAKERLTPYDKDHTTTHDESMLETPIPQAQQSNDNEVETSVQSKDSRDPKSDERIQRDKLTVAGINE